MSSIQPIAEPKSASVSGVVLHPAEPSYAAEPVSAPHIPYANAIPDAPAWQEWLTRVVASVSLGYSFYWIWWRWAETINWDVAIFSISLLAAETWGVLTTAVMVMTVWKLTRRQPPLPPASAKVDVFITTFDEPLEIVRRTAIGARAIRYPHRTYILDDGKRDEMLEMARQLGVGYIRRVGNDHAKAGNLNNALQATSGEFILQLDADHVPMPHMLNRMLGYFEDSKVAFVQSPQDFYNTDSFSHVVNDDDRRAWEENRIFFSLIQPGKDRWNSAFFCGSCGVLRRSALAAVGGFSTTTLIEDMETSIALHAVGFKSVYHGETLAYGLAPATAASYLTQRLRWGQGAMQVLRRMNPLFRDGLSWAQRIQYFSSVTTYFDGWHKLVLYLAPVVYFATGAIAVRVPPGALLPRLLPYMVLMVLSFELLSRGTGWVLISERYNMARFYTHIVASMAYFTRKPLRFMVTPKGTATNIPFSSYGAPLILAVVSVASVIWAFFAHNLGWVDYSTSGWGAGAFWINGIWIGWNVYFALITVHFALLLRQQRQDYRFSEVFPVRLETIGGDGRVEGRLATTKDLNPSGLAFRASFRLDPGTKVRVPLRLASGEIVADGTVVRVADAEGSFGGPAFEHGVRFDNLPLRERDMVELHSAHHSIPLWRLQYRQSVTFFRRAAEVFGDTRGARRRPVQLPAAVSARAGDGWEPVGVGLLDEVSSTGARLLLESPVVPGTRLRYEVPGTTIDGDGVVVFVRPLESPLITRYAVGLTSKHDPSPPGSWAFWRRPTAPMPLDPHVGDA